MKKVFWLLDVNYEVKPGQPELWMWGIDETAKRILIIDKQFQTYFYIIPKEQTSPDTIIERVRQDKHEYPTITKMEIVDKKYFGKPVKAIKVYCQNPEDVTNYAKNIQKTNDVEHCLETDIRYSIRYLIDNNVIPCGWHEIEVEEAKTTIKAQIDKVYEAKTYPQHIPETRVPPLRILGFSIICYSEKGTAKPDKNPVVIISVTANNGEIHQFTAEELDDKTIIESFVAYVKEFDPDVIVGYGSNSHDWQYLAARAKKHGVKFLIDRTETEPHPSVYGHVSVTGRANVDLFDYADEFPEVKLKTLENLADYLGVMKVKDRTIIEETDIADYWQNKQKRPLLLKYSQENTTCVLGIAKAILDFAIQLSSLVGLPLDHVGTAAVGFRVERYLIREAFKKDELIPQRQERPYIPYAGAVVLAPKPGMHENVAVLDFKAMYPSLMIAYNISPDTYISPEEPISPNNVNTAPDVKHRFRKEPAGFYKEILFNLIQTRDEIRRRLSKLDPKTPEYRALDARQKAVKIITNALYGYAGWTGARWYIKPVAEAATAWGRDTIQKTITLAQKMGLTIIYSDTDSVFVKNEPEKISKFAEEIRKSLGLEIKPDKTYTRILFTEAKKRYCGLLPNGELDMVGLEVVRGDWANVAKNLQEKILEVLLKEKTPQKAVKLTREHIQNMRERKIPYKDFIIWKTLTKPLEEYKVKAPHVEAARLLEKEGLTLSFGDKIGYVITAGEGKLYTRAKPYMLASYDDLDIEYYVTNQAIPAASRILAMFDVKEEELYPPKQQQKTSLTEFFKKD
ncbi:MAG: DNA polymerase domain-containing protein [Candidatus Bathyarchaeia archaeon]